MSAIAKLNKMHALGVYAPAAFQAIKSLLEDAKEGGAFTTVCGHRDSFLSYTVFVGSPSPGKLDKYRWLSQEKILRTMHRGDVSSFLSNDKDKEQYPGGVWIIPWGYGTSGFKSLDDEAFSIAMGVKAGDISMPTAEALARLSSNEDRVQRFLYAMKDLPFRG